MIRTTCRTARTFHRCSCGFVVCPGMAYLEHVASPNHDSLGNRGWWRLVECEACARCYGRVEHWLPVLFPGN